MSWALVLGVLEQSLKLWNSKESTKYLDRILKLKKEWHDAKADKDHDRLSDIQRELYDISESFVEAVGRQNNLH